MANSNAGGSNWPHPSRTTIVLLGTITSPVASTLPSTRMVKRSASPAGGVYSAGCPRPLYVCVCIYKCMYTYIHAYMRLQAESTLLAALGLCMYVCVCIYKCMHTYIHTYACRKRVLCWLPCLGLCVCVCVCMYTHTYIQNSPMCVCVHLCVYVSIHTHIIT
jgi:hypothetical protein